VKFNLGENFMEKSDLQNSIGHGVFMWASALVIFLFLFIFLTHVVRTRIVWWSVSTKPFFPVLYIHDSDQLT
jgi:Na+/serine symporter